MIAARIWRCFHCDEVFTDKAVARVHFGDSELAESACQIDAVKYREMERLHERNLAEDTDKDRQLAAMASNHATALRREEEAGYARGLRDGRILANSDATELTLSRKNVADVVGLIR